MPMIFVSSIESVLIIGAQNMRFALPDGSGIDKPNKLKSFISYIVKVGGWFLIPEFPRA